MQRRFATLGTIGAARVANALTFGALCSNAQTTQSTPAQVATPFSTCGRYADSMST